MLTAEETEEIDHEIAILPQRSSACIEALQVVQRHRGWVSDHAVEEIADYLGMSAAEVDSVATFYNLIFRQPVGRNVILLCNSVSCWIVGCEQVRAKIREARGIDYGQTSKDGRFTLLPMECLGDCDHAPAMMVGRNLHHDLEPDRVDEVLQRYDDGAGGDAGEGRRSQWGRASGGAGGHNDSGED